MEYWPAIGGSCLFVNSERYLALHLINRIEGCDRPDLGDGLRGLESAR